MAEQSPEQSSEQFLGDVLNNRIPVITPLADLPAWWRDAPPGEPDPNGPGFVSREALLTLYVDLADTKAWAGEGLRALLRYLLESFVKPPPLLVAWAVKRCAYGDPPPKRGSPEKVDRDNRVVSVFTFLRVHGYSYEASIGFIAGQLSCEPETIRSVLRKDSQGLTRRLEAAREFLRR